MFVRIFATLGFLIVLVCTLFVLNFGVPWMRLRWVSYGVEHVWCSHRIGHEHECPTSRDAAAEDEVVEHDI